MGTRLLLDRMMQHFQRILASPPFTRYLLVTNVVSGAIIDFTGDLITQKKVECAESTNWSRSGRMVTVGLVMSPLAHYWYIYLDRLFPLKSPRSIAKKLAVDSLVGGPIFLGGFYLGMSRLEGKTWKESFRELRQKFLPTFTLELIVWPPIQFINFYFLPLPLRLLFINATCLVWAIVLSTLKHNDNYFVLWQK